MTELSDELLVAHVDGRLARDQSRSVERVLESDAVTARRAKALRAAHERLETAFDALLAGEFTALTGKTPPERMEIADEAPQPGAGHGRGRVLLTAVACLALGMGVGYGWRGASPTDPGPRLALDPVITSSISPARETPATQTRARDGVPPSSDWPGAASWRDDVSRAYALYGRDWLEVSLESQGNLDFVRYQLSVLLGAPVAIPDLSGEGFAFKRADVLRSDGEPVAQMAYLPEQGAPLALYAKADDDTPAAGPSLHASDGVAMAAWTEGGFSYLLAARLPEARLQRLTETVRAQFARE